MEIIILAILAEAIWETLILLFEQGKFQIDRMGAIVVSVALTLVVGKDIFQMVGLVDHTNILTLVGTGIMVSRGSNVIHDIWDKIGGER